MSVDLGAVGGGAASGAAAGSALGPWGAAAGGLIGGLGGLLSSEQSSDAIRRGSEAAAAGQRQAGQTTQDQMGAVDTAFAPTEAAGNSATGQLQSFLQNYKSPTYNGPTSFSFDKFQDPASRNQMMMTQRGLDASSAASGGGGGAQRALTTELSNAANNAYQTALQSFSTQAGVGQQGFQRGLASNEQLMGGLSGLSNLGLSATSQHQGLRSGLANNLAGIQSGIGSTVGSGIVGSGMAQARGTTGLASGLGSAATILGEGLGSSGGGGENTAAIDLSSPTWFNNLSAQ